MAHDFSHLDEAAKDAICDANCITDTLLINADECAVAARTALLSALTPSDLAALLAEKCPGWKCVPRQPNMTMSMSAYGRDHCNDVYASMLEAAPKLGGE